MKEWRIFESSQGEVEPVRSGFNVWAFLFPPIWALIRGRYLMAVIAVVVSSLASGLVSSGAIVVGIAVSAVLSIVFGLSGNRWVAEALMIKGYREVRTIVAANEAEARQRHAQIQDGQF